MTAQPDGFREATIEFDIAELLSDGSLLDWFLDTISEKAFGTPLAQEIEYRITGVVDGTTVRMQVGGLVEVDE